MVKDPAEQLAKQVQMRRINLAVEAECLVVKAVWEISSAWVSQMSKSMVLIRKLRLDLSTLLVWKQPNKKLQNLWIS